MEKVKIFLISDRAGETPAEVEEKINKLLKKCPARLKVGGNFIVVMYQESRRRRNS